MTISIAPHTGPPTGAPEVDGRRPEELRGRSTGVVVCALAGLAWAASAIGALSTGVAVAVLLAGAATAAALLTGARRLRLAANRLPAAGSPSLDLSKVRRRFNAFVAVEFVAIAGAVNILGRTGHSQWIPAVVCAVVGVHLVPLARLFAVPLYYATGAALCIVAIATMTLGALDAPTSLWQLIPGLGAAAALWATGIGLLVTGPTRPDADTAT